MPVVQHARRFSIASALSVLSFDTVIHERKLSAAGVSSAWGSASCKIGPENERLEEFRGLECSTQFGNGSSAQTRPPASVASRPKISQESTKCLRILQKERPSHSLPA